MKPQNLLTGGNVELYDVALCYGINSYFNDEDKKFNIAAAIAWVYLGIYRALNTADLDRTYTLSYYLLTP